MEPDVRRYVHIVPPEVCQELIELGEMHGFDMDYEPVDGHDKGASPTQQIDVFNAGKKREIRSPDMYNILLPYIPEISRLIVNQRSQELHNIMYPGEPDKLPIVDWIFFRKYSPHSVRNSIIPHADSNMHSVNLQLNDGYTGGGFFYVKPPVNHKNKEWMDVHSSNYRWRDRHLGDGYTYQEKPRLKHGQDKYKWVNKIKRENTSEIVFPETDVGDIVMHNYTVWHAVAPIEEGVRYSMNFFYDDHNPMLEDDDDDDDDDHSDHKRDNAEEDDEDEL